MSTLNFSARQQASEIAKNLSRGYLRPEPDNATSRITTGDTLPLNAWGMDAPAAAWDFNRCDSS